MSSIALRIQNISKKYRIGTVRHDTLRDQIAHIASSSFQRTRNSKVPSSEIWALEDVSFDVHHGEIVGIIGHNGAGKSTLLKILSRITIPTSGRVEIFGKVGSLLEVGTGFHPELTGRENIYLNGAILGMHRTEIESKFDEIVAFSEIEKFLDTPVKRYSSGMYVRLAFAVAAHLEPEIMLVDEVLAVGDIDFQKKCLGKMSEVADSGRTVLLVSHNMASINKLSDLVCWIDKGKLRNFGASEEVIDNYKQTMVQPSSAAPGDDKFQKIMNHEHGIELLNVKTEFQSKNEMKSLVIKIQGRTVKNIRRIGIHIILRTPDGTLISKITPTAAKSHIENINGFWDAEFIFDQINRYLAGGIYMIDVLIGRPQFGIVINAKNAAIIQLSPIDYYGIGRYFTLNKNGIVPLPVKFTQL